MVEKPNHWEPHRRREIYRELDHPADLLVEVWGKDLPALFENALFALYDQVAELEGFGLGREETITAKGLTAGDALRSLLSEALYRFATSGFVAMRAHVDVRTSPSGEVDATAHLDGETLDRQRHTILSEVKAVTYHRLRVEPDPQGGWKATVLFDV